MLAIYFLFDRIKHERMNNDLFLIVAVLCVIITIIICVVPSLRKKVENSLSSYHVASEHSVAETDQIQGSKEINSLVGIKSGASPTSFGKQWTPL